MRTVRSAYALSVVRNLDHPDVAFALVDGEIQPVVAERPLRAVGRTSRVVDAHQLARRPTRRRNRPERPVRPLVVTVEVDRAPVGTPFRLLRAGAAGHRGVDERARPAGVSVDTTS